MHFWKIRIGLYMVILKKTSKTHEIAMKNGNFINVFLVKACSIKRRREKYMGMEERADFGQNMILVFLRGIHIFFFGVKYCVGPRVIFWEFIFFCFCKGMFQKTGIFLTGYLKVN